MFNIPKTFWKDMESPGFFKYIIYGDTDSLYINLPNVKYDTTEEAVKIADKVSKEINEMIAEYTNSEILSKLNVPVEYNKTEYKTELIANAMLLLGVKKNYAYKEIAKKGVIHKTPKIRYVGIPVVRTDFSQFTRDFIRKIVDEIALNENLNDKPISSILNELSTERFNKLKECLNTFNFKYIGIPGKWGMDTNYKNETYHIIAMRLYNTLTDTETFKPGTSGFSFPINLNNKLLISNKIHHSTNSLYLKKDMNIDKITYLSVPYNYDEQIIEKLFKNYQISIIELEYWNKLYSTSAKRIIEILKDNTLNLPPWEEI